MQITANVQEQKGRKRVCQKTSKKASRALESDSLGRRNPGKLVWDQQGEKSLVKDENDGLKCSTSSVKRDGGSFMAIDCV